MGLMSSLSSFGQALRNQARGPGNGEPPFVRGALPWLGVGVQYGSDADAFLREQKERHGDVFSVFLAGKRVTFLMHPLDYKVALDAPQLDFHEFAAEISGALFGHSHESFEQLMGQDVLPATNERLRGKALGTLTRRFQRELEQALLDEELPQTAPMFDFVAKLVYRTTGRSIFGEAFERDATAEDFLLLDSKVPLLAGGVPGWMLGVETARGKLQRALALELPDAAEVTAERLRMMSTLSEVDRGASQLAFLWATQANTIPATFWSLYHALRDPEARAALTAEVEAAFSGAERDPETGRALLDAKVLRKLPRVDSAIDEALRLTSASITLREATEDLTLELHDGRSVRIREGDRVGIFPRSMHLDPRLYEDPETYRHDRYYRDGKRQTVFTLGGERVWNYLMPFGGGRSICPGRHFAKNEIRIAVALLLHHLEAEVAEAPPLEVDKTRAGLGILPPVGDVELRLKRR